MFSELSKEQSEHSQKSMIKYPTFEKQNYLKTHILNNQEVSLLFGLRSKTVKRFNSDQNHPICGKKEDKQVHCITSEVTYPLHTRNADSLYSDIYSEDIKK